MCGTCSAAVMGGKKSTKISKDIHIIAQCYCTSRYHVPAHSYNNVTCERVSVDEESYPNRGQTSRRVRARIAAAFEMSIRFVRQRTWSCLLLCTRRRPPREPLPPSRSPVCVLLCQVQKAVVSYSSRTEVVTADNRKSILFLQSSNRVSWKGNRTAVHPNSPSEPQDKDNVTGIVERRVDGSLFSTNFWDHYNDYQDVHRHAKELLREKSVLDEDFVAFCVQRKGVAKNSLRHIIDLPSSEDYRTKESG
ncbi:hypothetical protein QTP88_023437 [Uroleucon formosanum]